MTRILKPCLLALALAMLAPAAAHAQAKGPDGFPQRPVRVLVPYAPGGATDIIARHLALRLTDLWGTSVVIDNRAGASGNIALETAARATPDGYTLFVGNVTTNAISETTFAGVLTIKPSEDLAGITNLVEIPHGLLVNPAFPAQNVRQLIDYAKANPGKVNYGSAGIGSYPHLDMLVFMRAAGIQMNHIPYKAGAAGFVTALISNEIQCVFGNLASTIEHIRAGRMRVLAVTMPARIPELPNVPTMTEQGFPGVGTNAWNGAFAPKGVPGPLLAYLYQSMVQVMERPDMKETLGKQMMAVSLSKSPADYTAFVRAETKKWAAVVRENNVKIE
jgi:tripartite-type tricarboxylate transporter receptor subunit TctC